MRFSVRLLLSFLFIGLFSILFLGFVFISLLTRRIDEEINSRLEHSQQMTFNQIESIKEKAIIQGEGLKRHPLISSALKEEEPLNYLRSMVQVKASTDLDILEILDQNGITKLSLIQSTTWGNDKSQDPLFKLASQGNHATGFIRSEACGLCILSAIPIRENGSILGILEVGYFFNERLLLQLKHEIGIDFTLYPIDGTVITTLVNEKGEYYSRHYEPQELFLRGYNQRYREDFTFANTTYRNIYFHLNENAQFLGPATFSQQNLDTSQKSVPSGKILGTVIASLPINYALASKTKALQISFVALFLITSFAISISLLISQKVAQHLENLTQVAQEVASGNFNVQAQETSTDEFGVLAKSLNKMIADLKEAFTQLEKDSRIVLKRDLDLVTLNQKLDQKNIQLQKIIATLESVNQKNDILLSNIGAGVLATDNDGNIIYSNRNLSKLSGIHNLETINKPFDDFFDLRNKDNAPIHFSDLQNHFAEAKEPWHLRDAMLTDQNNYVHPVNLVINPIKASLPQLRGFIIVFQDISKEKELEQMKLDFVSMAAHELRTPITAIRGYLATIQEESKEELCEEHQTFLQRAIISSDQLVSLMENLLAVARIEQGKITLRQESTDWTSVLEDAVKESELAAQERGLKLKLIPPDKKLPRVLVDRLRIVEVLNNLLQNAITYTPQGKVTVTTYLDKDKKRVVTSVQDTGQGIPTEALTHIFEKFYRVSGVLEQGSKGTGLGLYISKRIVELHDGVIWAESELGKGTTFYFTLPTTA